MRCRTTSIQGKVILIAGAGPSGLAAAVTLARAGKRVVIHEAQREVGYRFQRDLQGLENWTTEKDVLQVLSELGITIDFVKLPCHQGTTFDAWGKSYKTWSREPIFYMVERGPGPGTLDSALLIQAFELGVEVRFNSRIKQLEGPGILATGLKAADAIAVGYHFDTPMEDGFWVICDDNLAPQGYAYLLVMSGRGNVKSCMFSGFKKEKVYVERTVAGFKRLVDLQMVNPKPHGGVGNFHLPATAQTGANLVVGEQAGFQDTLWGFGIRVAIISGVLAARSLLEDGDYDNLWRRELAPLQKTSVVNRAIFSLLGNRGYRWFLHHVARQSDVRSFLRRQYHPSLIKRLMIPWAKIRYQSRRKDISCDHIDCTI